MKGCSDNILSREGITQGVPLSMFIYAVATISLICRLRDSMEIAQLWYADDSSAIGGFTQLCLWLDILIEIGSYYGYFPDPHKSSLVDVFDEANRLFSATGINVVLCWHFLGGVVGNATGCDEFVSMKTEEWEHHVDLLWYCTWLFSLHLQL